MTIGLVPYIHLPYAESAVLFLRAGLPARFCLSKHIQSGPVLSHCSLSAQCYPIELDVWSIVIVVTGQQHTDHQGEGTATVLGPATAGGRETGRRATQGHSKTKRQGTSPFSTVKNAEVHLIVLKADDNDDIILFPTCCIYLCVRNYCMS